MNIQEVLKHANLSDYQPEFLGEGAWHQAWKLTNGRTEPLVLRIPKKVAYNKEVPFRKEALQAEYEGTEFYYRQANQALKGSAPETFIYHVSEELTYTIESFAGDHVDLHKLKQKEAHILGKSIGSLYRQIEQTNHNLEGFGFFAWSEEKGLHGQFSGSFHSFIEEECEEVMEDYQQLSTKLPMFNQPEVNAALQRVCKLRMQEITKPCLTNQDASPENWLLDNGRVRLIDPLPILYFGEVMAGNFMNLYETLFVELAHTERYAKHRFHECRDVMQGIADGFLAGYCGDDLHLIRLLRGEQLLQVLNLAIGHLGMAEKGLNEEQIIRYGTKEDVKGRLQTFSVKMEQLSVLV